MITQGENSEELVITQGENSTLCEELVITQGENSTLFVRNL